MISVKITVHDEWVWVFDLEGVCCMKRGSFCKAGVYFHEEFAKRGYTFMRRGYTFMRRGYFC